MYFLDVRTNGKHGKKWAGHLDYGFYTLDRTRNLGYGGGWARKTTHQLYHPRSSEKVSEKNAYVQRHTKMQIDCCQLIPCFWRHVLAAIFNFFVYPNPKPTRTRKWIERNERMKNVPSKFTSKCLLEIFVSKFFWYNLSPHNIRHRPVVFVLPSLNPV